MTNARANSRLEALSDGVFAIAMTLLILDVRLPSTAAIAGTSEAWRALQQLAPSVFAFVLSFGVILITWVNHHAALRLVNKASAAFIYANGFLLLTVVFVPFPTGLLGTFLLTDHAAPAVVLYNGVLAAQTIAWVLVSGVALKHGLTRDQASAKAMRTSRSSGYSAFVLYTVLAIAAFWFPLASAIVTAVTWVFWLVLGIRMTRT